VRSRQRSKKSIREKQEGHRSPLDVVGLAEGRPPAAGSDVPDNGLDPMVTMIPVREGRAAPPVNVVISVDPAAGASTPVWAAAIVGARPPRTSPLGAPPARPCPSGLPPQLSGGAWLPTAPLALALPPSSA
jgi:hypothetical protein